MHRILLAALGVVVLLSACSDETSGPAEPTPMRSLSAREASINKSNSAFAFRIFNTVAQSQSDKNIFLSPLSISMALGMTMNGARGDTWEGMRTALSLEQLSPYDINTAWQGLRDVLLHADPAVQLTIANSIWCRNGFQVEQSFVDTNRYYFDAEVQSLDFNAPTAAGIINDWVSTNTAGRIPTIIDGPISPLTMMYLINAVYFKGNWSTRFDPERTHDAQFHAAGGATQTVRMMQRESTMRYVHNGSVQIVDLPYGWDRFSMAILLPTGEGSLADVREALAEEGNWTAWINALQDREIMLQLPRFRMEYEIPLKDALTTLGMEQAFSPYSADFTGINPEGELYISSVKHKTFVEVNEEGTEAAAVTSVEVGATSVPPALIVDRPFVFVIHERNTGAVLFIGQVNKIQS
ncbi:serpin family protein [bacterium]|nr:serpin family protein [bacterium]